MVCSLKRNRADIINTKHNDPTNLSRHFMSETTYPQFKMGIAHGGKCDIIYSKMTHVQ